MVWSCGSPVRTPRHPPMSPFSQQQVPFLIPQPLPTEGPKGMGPFHMPGLRASSTDGPAERPPSRNTSGPFLCSNSALNKGL